MKNKNSYSQNFINFHLQSLFFTRNNNEKNVITQNHLILNL